MLSKCTDRLGQCNSMAAFTPPVEAFSRFFLVLPAAVICGICQYFIFLSLVSLYHVGQWAHKKEIVELSIPHFLRK